MVERKWIGGCCHNIACLPSKNVVPHLMVVRPHQDDFQGFNRDGSNGMPYVAHLPGRTELYLVMPIRQWNEQ
jgi:hypothetical protein